MDIKKYFEDASKCLAELTDEEFERLLIKAGIEKCPFEEFTKIDKISFEFDYKVAPTTKTRFNDLVDLNLFECGGLVA